MLYLIYLVAYELNYLTHQLLRISPCCHPYKTDLRLVLKLLCLVVLYLVSP